MLPISFIEGKLDSQPLVHPNMEKEPLKPFPNDTNPETGEVSGFISTSYLTQDNQDLTRYVLFL